ncbi:MAG: PEP-CTERM sorting domain-containing protein [Fimbriimonadaceae bacterium]|nr:PEP-CTERM sorting domain-containing protein [Fimbriimonadaceae bacterium]
MNRLTLLAALVALACASQATILTFGDLTDTAGAPLGNYGPIDTAYGDNVTATSDAVGSYGMGTGWTPNVTTSYETLDGALLHYSDQLLHWDLNYGDLEHIAFAEVGNGTARVILTADAGWSVRLESFDLAGWPNADHALSFLRVLDGSYNTVWDSGATVAHGAGPTHDHYAPDIVGQTLIIEWGQNWNIGIDNISFSQTDAVPEPATMAVLGLGALALKRRRR